MPKPDLSELTNLPEDDLDDILAAIRRGASTPKELFDFDDSSLSSIENVALGYYRSEKYAEASLIYGLATRMDPTRMSCWRGLGACAQSQKDYDTAIVCYDMALERDPNDIVTKTCLGETCCLHGQRDRGLQLLREVVAAGGDLPQWKTYTKRARVILSSRMK
ncbi:MAG: hypothetical protein A2289_01500 [Deltaproteobacteria bacterium RIFOXYA12_FULL_58_15]|nr:MAG: hypothetical protein A2289_01500 [Deltaproteobacteria bacterium RIFOXYA12_FULL_58_15]OGR12670.1 MAG: hypothetical protein A2341_12485 [Deltaproteobacteria bacterium RIFOXYB12_FULL_58_9]